MASWGEEKVNGKWQPLHDLSEIPHETLKAMAEAQRDNRHFEREQLEDEWFTKRPNSYGGSE